jgi:hypothetical protein
LLSVAIGRDLSIVDTPGTNAIDRTHESLTRDYIPRSDLILFLTSAERPLSESERLLLEGISAWGKKTVLVVNKVCCALCLYGVRGVAQTPSFPHLVVLVTDKAMLVLSQFDAYFFYVISIPAGLTSGEVHVP